MANNQGSHFEKKAVESTAFFSKNRCYIQLVSVNHDADIILTQLLPIV